MLKKKKERKLQSQVNSQQFIFFPYNISQCIIPTFASKLSFMSISEDSGVFSDLSFNSGLLNMW